MVSKCVHWCLGATFQNQVPIISFTNWMMRKSGPRTEKIIWNNIQTEEKYLLSDKDAQDSTQKYQQDDVSEGDYRNSWVQAPFSHQNCIWKRCILWLEGWQSIPARRNQAIFSFSRNSMFLKQAKQYLLSFMKCKNENLKKVSSWRDMKVQFLISLSRKKHRFYYCSKVHLLYQHNAT